MLAGLRAFREVEVGGSVATAPAPGPLRVAAWNLERCLYPGAAAALLRDQGAGLVLLGEMDAGMHRTGNRHTTRELASRLGHRYAFGLEFSEVAVGVLDAATMRRRDLFLTSVGAVGQLGILCSLEPHQ